MPLSWRLRVYAMFVMVHWWQRYLGAHGDHWRGQARLVSFWRAVNDVCRLCSDVK